MSRLHCKAAGAALGETDRDFQSPQYEDGLAVMVGDPIRVTLNGWNFRAAHARSSVPEPRHGCKKSQRHHALRESKLRQIRLRSAIFLCKADL